MTYDYGSIQTGDGIYSRTDLYYQHTAPKLVYSPNTDDSNYDWEEIETIGPEPIGYFIMENHLGENFYSGDV